MPLLSPTDEGIATAAAALRAGELVGMPTETVYGLAGNADDGAAVAKIYETKGRPQFNPLIVHVADLEMAARIVELSPAARALAEAFWPGPLTLVLPRQLGAPVAELATAGLDTVAVRLPAHPIAKALLKAFGAPLVAPSANRSGRVSPTTPAHVAAEFGEALPILDGGPCDVGLESTIIGFDGEVPVLLRPGAVTPAEVEDLLGTSVRLAQKGSAITAPGMLTSHYAPNAAVRLNATDRRAGEVFLGFGGQPGADIDLSATANLGEAAAALFGALRALDKMGKTIAVAPIPTTGLGLAINDRLSRAAAPRDA